MNVLACLSKRKIKNRRMSLIVSKLKEKRREIRLITLIRKRNIQLNLDTNFKMSSQQLRLARNKLIKISNGNI